MISYILKPITLSGGGNPPTGYYAQTVQTENRTTADFVRMMVAAKGSGTEGEAAQWLDVFVRTFVLELSQGRNVNIAGFINAGVGIKGSFPDNSSGFDPERNSLKPTAYFSRAIVKAIKGSPVNRVSTGSSGIYIENVRDTASGTENTHLTPGMVLRITGSKIKLAGDAPEVGISFIDPEGNTTLVPPTAVSRNGAKGLDLVIPSLSAGVYKVKVTTQFAGTKTLLHTPRSYIYDVPLTVTA